MNNKELKGYLDALTDISAEIEEAYIDNGGEVTDETEALEARADAIRELLEGEGIDSLGRWLKAQEDRIAALKAEKDAIARQQKAAERTVEYIKAEIAGVMFKLGLDNAKGSCYSFSAIDKKNTTVDKDLLNAEWKDKALQAIREAGVPLWVNITLSASVSSFQLGDPLPDCIKQVIFPSVTFRKPKAAKED